MRVDHRRTEEDSLVLLLPWVRAARETERTAGRTFESNRWSTPRAVYTAWHDARPPGVAGPGAAVGRVT